MIINGTLSTVDQKIIVDDTPGPSPVALDSKNALVPVGKIVIITHCLDNLLLPLRAKQNPMHITGMITCLSMTQKTKVIHLHAIIEC